MLGAVRESEEQLESVRRSTRRFSGQHFHQLENGQKRLIPGRAMQLVHVPVERARPRCCRRSIRDRWRRRPTHAAQRDRVVPEKRLTTREAVLRRGARTAPVALVAESVLRAEQLEAPRIAGRRGCARTSNEALLHRGAVLPRRPPAQTRVVDGKAHGGGLAFGLLGSWDQTVVTPRKGRR